MPLIRTRTKISSRNNYDILHSIEGTLSPVTANSFGILDILTGQFLKLTHWKKKGISLCKYPTKSQITTPKDFSFHHKGRKIKKSNISRQIMWMEALLSIFLSVFQVKQSRKRSNILSAFLYFFECFESSIGSVVLIHLCLAALLLCFLQHLLLHC